jgi:hypothetical protein
MPVAGKLAAEALLVPRSGARLVVSSAALIQRKKMFARKSPLRQYRRRLSNDLTYEK